MKPLPTPVSGGSIEMLRPFLNVQSDPDFVLAVAWMLGVLRDRGPYPVLVLSGEQGSAKSTFSAMMRALSTPTLHRCVRCPERIVNFSLRPLTATSLPSTTYQACARGSPIRFAGSATGGGFAVRQLFTDQDEVLFDATRPRNPEWHRGHRGTA